MYCAPARNLTKSETSAGSIFFLVALPRVQHEAAKRSSQLPPERFRWRIEQTEERLHKLYLPEPLTKYVSVFAHSR